MAGPPRFTLEKEKRQSEDEISVVPYAEPHMVRLTTPRDVPPADRTTEDRYEAVSRSPGATKTTLQERDVQSGSDMAAPVYGVVLAKRNRVPYQSPPNGEKGIYSALKHKIYVHLDRKKIHIDHQIGVG